MGCIGLCKPVTTDKGSTFSTYAYRLIWHEICDVLAKASAPPHVVKGIDAMLLMAKSYTCREIRERMGASDNLVSAYVSKARKFLKGRPKSAQMMEIYAA